MPTASELGLLPNQGIRLSERIGQTIEVKGVPTYNENKDGIEFIQIPTTTGIYTTSSNKVKGSFRSTTENSVGDLLSKALAKKKTLTLWVTEDDANNDSGRKNLGVSAYKPRN